MWFPDPPPCPVDDAPHTTCTSPDYQPSRLVIVQLPMRDAVAPDLLLAPPDGAGPPIVSPRAFTSGSYVRARHKAGKAAV